MNYIILLTAAIERLSRDDSLNPSHVSLYIALFYQWNINRFNNPISVSRTDTMTVSKIGSKSTYHKCMRDLNDKGYLIYLPSHNPLKGSLIEMTIFKTTCGTSTRTTKKQLVGQALVPSINSINNTNTINYIEGEIDISPRERKPKKKNGPSRFKAPTLQEAEQYFLEQHATTMEAARFFNHFESNGWLVGGRTKMKDWKAAARNWISRSKEFNRPLDINPLSTTTTKNYSEPL